MPFARMMGVVAKFRFMEDNPLGTKNCPLCGDETPRGQRYCKECDSAGTYATSESRRRPASAAAARGSSNLPLVLLFFMFSAFGTVMTGFFAPNALSLPLLGDIAAPQQAAWGEIRLARVNSNIRARASTSSEITGKLAVGDSVRVEPAPGGWFKVYRSELVPREKAEPLGFVFGRLLESADVQVADEASGGS